MILKKYGFEPHQSKPGLFVRAGKYYEYVDFRTNPRAYMSNDQGRLINSPPNSPGQRALTEVKISVSGQTKLGDI